MTDVHPDLLYVLDRAVIQSPTRFAVREQIHELDDAPLEGLPAEASAARERALLTALEDDLYRHLYVRWSGPVRAIPSDDRSRRERLASLQAANSGRGRWDRGWVVREIGSELELVLSKDDLTLWAAAEEVRAPGREIRTGQVCSVWLGKEQRTGIPGFYFAAGEAEDECDASDSEPFLRYYWHLSSEAAVPFVASATEQLNAAGVPFLLKVLSDPCAFWRADAGLIFTRKRYRAMVENAIARIHEAVAWGLRESVPLFTKPVARGLGGAEDPSGGMSFGDHRCKLAARALWRSFLRDEQELGARAATIAAVYAEEGLDPRYPWLGPGSGDEFGPPIASPATSPRAIPSGSGAHTTESEMPNGVGCPRIAPCEAAKRIGESLCQKAVWDRSGRYCNWMGRVFSGATEPGGLERMTVSALGPDVQEGSAGIGLFLTHLYGATGDDEFRRTAVGAFRRTIRLHAETQHERGCPTPKVRSETLTDAGRWYAGVCELALFRLSAAIKRGDLAEHQSTELRAAIAATLDAIDAHIDVPRFDTTLRNGLAGLGEVVLTAGVLLKDRSYQERAIALGRVLIDRYSEQGDWPTGLPGGGPNPSLFLGLAGIGYWLLRLDAPEKVPPLVRLVT